MPASAPGGQSDGTRGGSLPTSSAGTAPSCRRGSYHSFYTPVGGGVLLRPVGQLRYEIDSVVEDAENLMLEWHPDGRLAALRGTTGYLMLFKVNDDGSLERVGLPTTSTGSLWFHVAEARDAQIREILDLPVGDD